MELKIQIIGKPGAGKTTMACLLHNALEQVGLKAVLIDSDVPSTQRRSDVLRFVDERLASLRKRKPKITISTLNDV